MWPFGSGKRMGKTVAETRAGNSSAIVSVANRIHELQQRVVRIERDAPYIKNNREREKLEKRKMQIEREIEKLEKKHHQLVNANKG